jgi:hypothetical protein
MPTTPTTFAERFPAAPCVLDHESSMSADLVFKPLKPRTRRSIRNLLLGR